MGRPTIYKHLSAVKQSLSFLRRAKAKQAKLDAATSEPDDDSSESKPEELAAPLTPGVSASTAHARFTWRWIGSRDGVFH